MLVKLTTERSENGNIFKVYSSQENLSNKIVEIVRDKIGSEKLKEFLYFDVYFFVPMYLSLYDQTLKRVSSFIDHCQVNK